MAVSMIYSLKLGERRLDNKRIHSRSSLTCTGRRDEEGPAKETEKKGTGK